MVNTRGQDEFAIRATEERGNNAVRWGETQQVRDGRNKVGRSVEKDGGRGPLREVNMAVGHVRRMCVGCCCR